MTSLQVRNLRICPCGRSAHLVSEVVGMSSGRRALGKCLIFMLLSIFYCFFFGVLVTVKTVLSRQVLRGVPTSIFVYMRRSGWNILNHSFSCWGELLILFSIIPELIHAFIADIGDKFLHIGCDNHC